MDNVPITQDEIVSPYVGLIPFEEKMARYFFGRETDIRIAATNLRAASVTIFYGASGVGKSSLINAGIVPYLKNIAATPIPGKMPEFTLVVIRDWVNDPLISLQNAIKKAVEEFKDPPFTKDEFEKEAVRNSQNRSLCRLLKNWKKFTKTNFLIILDQFEIFLSDESKPEYKTGAGSFGEEFSKALNTADLPVNFMISLRDDALAQLDFFRNRTPNLIKNTLRLDHLDRRAAKDAVEKPLEQYNADKNTRFSIESELVEKLLDEIKVGKINFDASTDSDPNQKSKDDPAAEKQTVPNPQTDRIETPFLQLVMNRLWQEVKEKKEPSEQIIKMEILEGLSSLEEPNPVRNIVKTYLDEVMSGFTDEQKVYASKFIHFTVSASGAKRSSTIEELTGYTEKKVGESEIEKIMKVLTLKKRIFKNIENRADPKKPFYEVTHDALVPAILSWRKREYEKIENQKKLEREERNRLREERKKLEEKAKLEDQAKRLVEAEQLSSTQAKLLAEEQHSREIQQERLAKEQQLRVTQEKLLAEELHSSKIQQELLAKEQHSRAIYEELLVIEKYNRKRGRILVGVIALLTSIIGILGWYWYSNDLKQKEIALKNKDIVVNEKDTVIEKSKEIAKNENQSSEEFAKLQNKNLIAYQSLCDILIGLRSENPNEVDKALNQLKVKAEKKELPEEYKDQIAKMLSDKKIAPLDLENLKKTQEIVKNYKSITGVSKNEPTVIFIQFQNEDNRLQARNLRNLLNNNGFLAPGVENVGAHPEIKQIQLRYFRGDEKDPTLNNVLTFLRNNSIPAVPVKVEGYENSPQFRPNQFELWFTGDGIPNISAAANGNDLSTKN